MWYNRVMKHNRFITAISLIGLAALILMLNLTSPTEIGPVGVLLFFICIYVTLFGLVTFLMKSFYRIGLKRDEFRRKDYVYAAVGAFGPIMLLMARSFGAITVWTVGLVIFCLFLAEFLVYKRI